MRIAVTGGSGFAGSHFIDFLLKKNPNDEIYVLRRWHSTGHFQNLDHLKSGSVKFFEGDLTDAWSMLDFIRTVKPDQIAHIAAHTYVPYSYSSPLATMDTNCQGTINLLEAIRHEAPQCKILIVSSGEVFGSHDGVITEESALNPRSPYGLGKLAEDRAAYLYQQSYGLDLVIARSFSQVGPRKFVGLFDSSWAFQIARMERRGFEPVLHVGKLDTTRTFCDIHEMVEAYHLYLNQGTSGDMYIICGNSVLRMDAVIEMLRGMTSVKFDVVQDPARMRPTDVMKLAPVCDPFKKRFGWEPKVSYETSLLNLLSYWRERLK